MICPLHSRLKWAHQVCERYVGTGWTTKDMQLKNASVLTTPSLQSSYILNLPDLENVSWRVFACMWFHGPMRAVIVFMRALSACSKQNCFLGLELIELISLARLSQTTSKPNQLKGRCANQNVAPIVFCFDVPLVQKRFWWKAHFGKIIWWTCLYCEAYLNERSMICRQGIKI